MNFQDQLQPLDRLIYKVFHLTPEGKELLKLLKEQYLINTPSADVNKPDWYAYFRDGENNIIRRFIRVIINIQSFEESKNE